MPFRIQWQTGGIMAENESSWESPVVQVLLGGVIVLVIDGLLVAVLVVTSTLWDLVMIVAFCIGFLQWLYVFPLGYGSTGPRPARIRVRY